MLLWIYFHLLFPFPSFLSVPFLFLFNISTHFLNALSCGTSHSKTFKLYFSPPTLNYIYFLLSSYLFLLFVISSLVYRFLSFCSCTCPNISVHSFFASPSRSRLRSKDLKIFEWVSVILSFISILFSFFYVLFLREDFTYTSYCSQFFLVFTNGNIVYPIRAIFLVIYAVMR